MRISVVLLSLNLIVGMIYAALLTVIFRGVASRSWK